MPIRKHAKMATATKPAKKPARKKGVHASTICPLLKAGEAIKCNDNYIAVMATTTQMFVITQKHIDNGIPNHPRKCIVGLAMEAGFGSQYRYEIGIVITKIIDEENKVFVRYMTPPAISEQIKKWERPGMRGQKFGTWKIPPGPQILGAIPPSLIRLYKGQIARGKKPPKGTRFTRKSREERISTTGGHVVKHRASPTRIVGRVAYVASPKRRNEQA